uniref:Uncharacterized protein n=1 Tax=Oryza brachyantha TaxID=4533 RepID=J3NB99_ORYBR
MIFEDGDLNDDRKLPSFGVACGAVTSGELGDSDDTTDASGLSCSRVFSSRSRSSPKLLGLERAMIWSGVRQPAAACLLPSSTARRRCSWSTTLTASASPDLTPRWWRRASKSISSSFASTALNWNGMSNASASLDSTVAMVARNSLLSWTAVMRRCGGPSRRLRKAWNSAIHCTGLAAGPEKSTTCTNLSPSMASRMAWFVVRYASFRNGSTSNMWRRATGTRWASAELANDSSALEMPGTRLSSLRESASAKTAARRCSACGASRDGAARRRRRVHRRRRR